LRELREPRFDPRDREPLRLLREDDFPELLFCRDLEERLFRAMIKLRL
jgi:hypothetical protein